jgi:hypothetical protein
VALQIERMLLEKTSKELIETILFCLPDVYAGTFYSIGKPPDLIAERVTTGILDKQKNEVVWGITEPSEFNPPGKPWSQYRDEPGKLSRPLAWCISHQQGQTIDNRTDPGHESNISQSLNKPPEIYRLEPVLVPKSALDLDIYPSAEYPRDFQNNVLWKDSDQAVVGIIKLSFKALPVTSGIPQIQVIQKLTNSLGSKLLSYQLRQDSIKAMQQVSKERLYACNILADSLRNAITKSGLIFSLIKQEIGYLRNQWEKLLFTELQEKDRKKEAIQSLDTMLTEIVCKDQSLVQDLIRVQNKFLELSLPPEKGENWVVMQIETRWCSLLELFPQNDALNANILKTIGLLKSALYFGLDPFVTERYTKIPFGLKKEWINLIYQNLEKFNPNVLNRIIKILEDNGLQIESRERSYRRLVQLKALAETMNQLEHNTNFLLQQVLNGGTEELLAEYFDQFNNKLPKRDKAMSEESPKYPAIPLNS